MRCGNVALILAAWALCPQSASATTVTFQQGAGGYGGTRDSYLSENAPASTNGTREWVEWDSDDPAGTGLDTVALIRFEQLFGNGTGQIPATAAITSATLTLTVNNAGDAGLAYEAAVDWDDSVTWNTFGPAAGVQSGDYVNLLGAVSGASGTVNFDVTASLQRWLADPASNRGWVILPQNNNGVEFRSSQYAAAPAQRPKLTVVYSAAAAVQLVREPYLQLATPLSIVIAWRTNVATDSRVRFGPSPAQLNQFVSDATLATNHFIPLAGLSPGTTYYYDVGSTTQPLAGGTTAYRFTTPPPIGSVGPFSAWIVGDSGNGQPSQYAVRDAMSNHVGTTPFDLFLHVGDIAYNSGTDQEFTNYFYAAYQDVLRRTVCWPTLGNHEGANSFSSTQTGPYFAGYVLPNAAQAGGLASGTEAYYSFDYANVHFISLNSQDVNRNPGSAMLTWLAADLAATNQQWVIAFWHHPPYSKGTHDSDDPQEDGGREVDMRENVLPILEAGGVDLVLTGHSHIYERSYLVDSAYDTPTTAPGHIVDAGDGKPAGDGPYLKSAGLNAHDGAVYVVAGHGGQPCGQSGVHPLMYFTETENGSCLLSVSGNVLSLQNVRDDGVVSDHFQIVKPPAGDIDADGDLDAADVDLFVGVLLGLDLDVGRNARSDLNNDASANGQDAAMLVANLLN